MAEVTCPYSQQRKTLLQVEMMKVKLYLPVKRTEYIPSLPDFLVQTESRVFTWVALFWEVNQYHNLMDGVEEER